MIGAVATPEAYRLFHEGAIALAEIESNGIKVDTAYLEQAIQRVDERVEELEGEMEETDTFKLWMKIFGRKTNLGSYPQLGRIIYKELGYPVLERTEKGQPKVDADALADIDLDFIQLWVQCEKLKDTKTNFLRNIEKELDEQGFLHCFYNLHLARSYRSSSSSVNFQNFPIRDPITGEIIRRCFVPRHTKWQIIETDFSGIEVRLAACYNKDPRLIEYIKDPTKDMHRDMAMQLLFLEADQVAKAVRHVSKNKFVFPEFYGSYYVQCALAIWKELSRGGLKVEGSDVTVIEHLKKHGIKGLGACNPDEKPKRGTFEHHVMEVEQDFWANRFRVYTKWKKKWWSQYQENGYCRSLTGFVYQGALNRKQVINYPIQGSAFHCLLWSLIQVRKELKKRKMKTKLLGQIHDSIVADAHPREVDDYLQIVKHITTEALAQHWRFLCVPMAFEADVAPPGASWHEKKGVKV